MAQRNTGYNNPAFCNQYDSSLYDYEYVPEIDPDSPELHRKGSYRISRQTAPKWDHQAAVQMLNNSNSSSDGSVIIEERNNRRVTMICEKRKPKVIADRDGGYSHDISLDSDSNNEEVENMNFGFGTIRPRYAQSNQYRNHHQNKTQHNMRPRHENPPPYEEPTMYQRRHRYAEIDEELETEGVHFTHRKPRAPSPQTFLENSPNFADLNDSFIFRQTSSPLSDLTNSFEMSDFPPRQNDFAQRQPPVGAPTSHVLEPGLRLGQDRQERFQTREDKLNRTPSTNDKGRLVTPRSNGKSPMVHSSKPNIAEQRQKQSVRRNISSSFISSDRKDGSPYRTTTQKNPTPQRSTAIITPILQRKFADLTRENSNFQKASRLFQSTTNVRRPMEGNPQNNFNVPEPNKMKRNQSVPNFQQYEKRTPSKVKDVEIGLQNHQMELSPEKFSPLSKSRLSLLETMKNATMGQEDLTLPSGGCLLLAAVVQLLAGLVTCAICFYLLSMLGRRYYLELGVIAGFVTSILGALGFRSQKWKWLPNRNYVSGYTILSGFSVLNLASVVLIIVVKPHSGDPFLDVCAGAICAISVIVVGIALMGLTMSGCCRTPPPDNRVNFA